MEDSSSCSEICSVGAPCDWKSPSRTLERDELEKLCVVGDIGHILAVLLPFKHSVDVQFEFEYRGDEDSRGFIVHYLESSEVLLHSVMQVAQFLATAILKHGSFEDRANVHLINEMWTTVAGLQAFNGFSVALARA